MYGGRSKPDPLEDFLSDFIREINELGNTTRYQGQLYSIRIAGFICDAPARSYLKGIVGHQGYYSCERCSVKGSQYSNRMVFNVEEESLPRTHELFKEMT